MNIPGAAAPGIFSCGDRRCVLGYWKTEHRNGKPREDGVMRDIENRADIDALMSLFYNKVLTDDVIGYLFTDVAKLDLDHHLPVIGDFWETVLLGTGNY